MLLRKGAVKKAMPQRQGNAGNAAVVEEGWEEMLFGRPAEGVVEVERGRKRWWR
ncbi:MAG TPA: hypothetical protein IAC04_01605 [Candidatus Coprenecus stercoravium]|uniref:Uncharacterized protein n=1 Tax=Candidatus Coprenecus stercoravium TaxID=2840735 RepID=A0A9D2GPA6_9BACT|nr:hypothetical protein [Candidatus Coprenecus stercoravium]